MKIVFYSHSTTLYGAPTSLLNLVQGLLRKDANKYKISVILPDCGPLYNKIQELPVRVYVLPFAKWSYSMNLYKKKSSKSQVLAKVWFYKNVLQKAIKNIVFFAKHVRILKNIKPDLVYVNSSLCPTGILAAKVCSLKSIWHHREIINDSSTDFFIEYPEFLVKRVLTMTNFHLYPSNFLKDYYADLVPTCVNEVIYNGVSFFSHLSKLRIRNKRLKIGMVGRINHQKGQVEVLNFLLSNNLMGFTINIYGTGEPSEMDLVQSFSNSLDVVIRGFQPKETIYSEIDYLLVNAKNESFGRVVAEAFCCGIPVIALNSGALTELIEDGITGFLFHNMEDLKQILKSIEDYNYEILSTNCFQTFAKRFSIEKYTNDVIKFLDSHII